MRGLLLMVAVLALAGCGAGDDKPAKVQAPAPAVAPVQAQAAAAPQWDVLIDDPKAVSDLTDRLMEHGFASFVSVRDGKERVLLGPFSTREAAEEKRAQVALKMSYASEIVDHTL